MKNLKTIAAMLLLSISSTITFTSCQDDAINENKVDSKALASGANGQNLKAYGLTYHNFVGKNDVMILNADTTEISVNKALAEKMGITTFVNHPMGIWDAQNHLPYARKATAEKLVGDRYILKVVPATVAELVGENKVTLNTAAYFNPNVQGAQTRAGIEMPEFAAKYTDENGIIHPAIIHMTDEYGYDKDYYTDEDRPKAGTRSNGEYQFITGEELANGTRFSVNRNILSVHKEIKSEVKLPCGKSGGDNAKMTVKAPIDFELNYFLTLNGGYKFPIDIYVKKFETGLDGKFGMAPEVKFEMKKEWKLDADKFTYKLAKFHGYSFTFMVGFIPVVVTCSPNMYARIDGSVNAEFKAGFKYEYESTFKGGVRYTKEDGWSVINEFKEEKNVFTFYKPTAKVHAEAGVAFYIGMDVMLYDVAGPTASVGPRLGAEADLKAQATATGVNLDLKAKVGMSVNAEVGAKLSLLGYDLAEYHKGFVLGGPWTIWQYPTTGQEHQVGKVLTEEEKWWQDVYAFIDDAQKYPGTEGNLRQMLDELADMRSQVKGGTKEEHKKAIVVSILRQWVCPDYRKIPTNNNLNPNEQRLWDKGRWIFRNHLITEYKGYTKWFNSQSRLAYEEFLKALMDCDEVKQVAAANPGKINQIIEAAVKQFKRETLESKAPTMTKEDMEKMVKYIVEQGKNFK